MSIPLKDTIPNLFGGNKVFIKRVDGDGDWQEVEGVIRDAISIKPKFPDTDEVTFGEPIKVTFKASVDWKKIRKAWLKLTGKPRKTTYKTLRHDCAKRNGRR